MDIEMQPILDRIVKVRDHQDRKQLFLEKSRKHNMRRCLIFAALVIITWSITAMPVLIFVVVPWWGWNSRAETTLAQVISHDVYIKTDGRGEASIVGWIYLDFPKDSKTKFDKCGDENTERECENYLQENYPIGHHITIYYDPDNPKDVRFDKKPMFLSISWVILFTLVGSWFIPAMLCCGSERKYERNAKGNSYWNEIPKCRFLAKLKPEPEEV